MPTDLHKPLFRPEALRPKLKGFSLPPTAVAARAAVAQWASLLASPTGVKRKETELLPNFLADVFERLLGYVPPPANPYTLQRETHIQVDGKFADAALGRFGDADAPALVVEGKGPKDPLDRPFAGR